MLVSSAIRDITDRKKAEEKFRGLLESAPDAMVIVNRDGRIVLVNAQTEKLFGYTPRGAARPVGRAAGARALPQASTPATATATSPIPRSRSMGSGLELYGLRKDGSEFPDRDQPEPARDRGGHARLERHPRHHRAQARPRTSSAACWSRRPTPWSSWTATAASCWSTRRPRSCSATAREELLGRPIEMLVPERFRGKHPEHRDGYFADPEGPRPMGSGLELLRRCARTAPSSRRDQPEPARDGGGHAGHRAPSATSPTAACWKNACSRPTA